MLAHSEHIMITFVSAASGIGCHHELHAISISGCYSIVFIVFTVWVDLTIKISGSRFYVLA